MTELHIHIIVQCMVAQTLLTRASSSIAIQPVATPAATPKCSSRVGTDLVTTTISRGTLIDIWKCKMSGMITEATFNKLPTIN